MVAKSSNYELYGDPSSRTMELLGRHAAWQEVYSIDDSFRGLDARRGAYADQGGVIRAAVARHTGPTGRKLDLDDFAGRRVQRRRPHAARVHIQSHRRTLVEHQGLRCMSASQGHCSG
ncbi:hypothetical protein [Tersicoccus mangrovi]|uniref:hypothetical protein n=1 Tax=Tersicoccus mangrovi TaxID=3121635 RepID=UPI003A7F2CFC